LNPRSVRLVVSDKHRDLKKRFETLLSRGDLAAMSDPLPTQCGIRILAGYEVKSTARSGMCSMLRSETSLETGQQIDRRMVKHISGFISLVGRNHRRRIGSICTASLTPQAVAKDQPGRSVSNKKAGGEVE